MAGHSQFSLLGTKRFLPLFMAIVIGAFNDNAFRLSLTTLYSYGALKGIAPEAGTANSLLAALFTLPFFLFSALAGQISDKFDKAVVARRIKLIEIFLIALASYSLFSQNFTLQMICIFFAGCQAAFFGPIKYSILPQHLHKSELLGGNGLVESGTSLAILAGMLFGMFFIVGESGRHFVSAFMIGLAILGYVSAWFIPAAPSAQPEMKINTNLLAETWTTVKMAMEKRDVWLSVLGISWFWFMGVIFLTQIEPFTRDVLHATLACSTLILAFFSVATGLGSATCNRLLAGKITLRFVPVAALFISLFTFDLYFASGGFGRYYTAEAPAGPSDLIWSFQGLRTLFDLCGIAFMSGLFVVPLFALMQARTPYYRRARIVGANNIVNAAYMVVASVLAAIALKFVSVRGLYVLLGLFNMGIVGWLAITMPQALIAGFARFFFRLFYRVEVKGMEHYWAAGKRVLIVPNHTSFLDGPLLSVFLPERAAFAVNTMIAKQWWAKPAFVLYDLCALDPANALSLRDLVRRLKRNQKVVIFPEGRITITGGLMKVYEGPAAIAEMARATVLPVRIEGALQSPFSRVGSIYPSRWFPKITLTFLPPVRLEKPQGMAGPNLRHHQAEQLYDVMVDMMFQSSDWNKTFWQSLLTAKAKFGGGKVVFEDTERKPMTYGRLILGSVILGRKLANLTRGQKYVGVLLPTANATPVTVFGLQATGRIPAMLNFSTGVMNMTLACTAAQVRSIVTSRRFIEVAEMEKDIEELAKKFHIIYLEDVRGTVGTLDKVVGMLAKLAMPYSLKWLGATSNPDDPAAVLFTSGSEGVPKGVVLSHRNVEANSAQVMARIALNPADIFFTALPLFHAFGFLSMVLVVTNGIRSFLYPSPLHYKIIPELVYDTGATVLFSTDTFLANYAKFGHPYDFHSVRLLVGGAERVKPETRALWMDRFGLRIIEGYGATECAPVIAANTFMHNRSCTVGRIFDGMEYKLEPVEGIQGGGRLFIKGPNVMKGYLRADNPGEIEKPHDGWHDTGDICAVDEWKYVTILGRAKRFAKIAGEMVSLTALEMKLQAMYPENPMAVVAVPDKKKGEQLVLFSTTQRSDRKSIADGLRAQGATELMIPKTIITLDQLPVLKTGKIDYVTLNNMAREQVVEG